MNTSGYLLQNKDTVNSKDTYSFQFLYRHRKELAIIAISAVLISLFFSSSIFITPLFKSSVILYPVSSNSISRSLLNENTSGKQDIMEFGEDEQTEQMLQILNSSRIRDRIINKFNLSDHYDIPADSKYAQTRLFKKYASRIKFKRTEFMAVKIIVLDKDPKLAATIADEIAVLFDSVKNDMQKQRAVQGFKIIETEYLSLQAEVKAMEDSLTQLRKLGIHDYETQAEMINQQLAMEISKGNRVGIQALEEKLNTLATYGGPYVSIRNALEFEKKQLSYVKARYAEAKIDATKEIPQKFIIEDATIAERKSYPNNLVIVIMSTLCALALGMMGLLFVDNKRKVRTDIHLLYKGDQGLNEETKRHSVSMGS